MKTKNFDCVDFKRASAENIYEILKNMTSQEQLNYWKQATLEMKNKLNKKPR